MTHSEHSSGRIRKASLIRDVFFPKKGTDAYESKQRLRKVAAENKKRFKAYRQRDRQARHASYKTVMNDPANLLEFDNLCTYFFTDVGTVKAVDGVSFSVPAGATVGVVGESGCGKSVTALSLMRLIQGPSGQIVSGAIRFNDDKGPVDVTKMPIEDVRKLRGNRIAMIFQEPMTSLNPVFTIGNQIDEVIQLHNPDWSEKKVKDRSIEMLEQVGMSRPKEIYAAYPHELSGGMRQRAMIAMALACSPRLIIADEPTTALDVTIQAQILDLMRQVKDSVDASIMLITHDLGVIAEMADYVVVMYAGRVIELGTASHIYHNPLHPYTKGLILSKPAINRKQKRLYSIPGSVPNPIAMPNHCYFRDRCGDCYGRCSSAYPGMCEVEEGHWVSCHLYDDNEEARMALRTALERHAEEMRANAAASKSIKAEGGRD